MMMRRSVLVARAFAITAMAAAMGCGTVAPMVEYKSFPIQLARPDLEGYLKFKFSGSAILIDEEKDAAGKSTGVLSIASVPYEDPDDEIIAIIKADPVGISNNLVLTHRSNSLLIDSIGTDIQDNRLKLIEQVGGAVTTLVSGGYGIRAQPVKREAPAFPALIEVNKYLKEKKPKTSSTTEESDYRAGTGLKLTENKTTLGNEFVFEVVFGPIPGDAINRAEFKSLGATARSVLFYSACRDATVTVRIKKDANEPIEHVARLKVADSNFLETVALPAKGKISMDSACGVNVSSDPANVSSNAEILNKLIEQVKAIDAAKNKKQ
jgi:hypothetical protein